MYKSEKKKSYNIRMEENIKNLTNEMILQRSVLKGMAEIENFSSLVRNLILEEHERLVKRIKKEAI